MTIEVLVELKAKRIDKTYTYSVPEILKDNIKIGIRVLVPFGSQKLEGFVLKITNDNSQEYELKQIIDIIDEEPVINEEMLELGKYVSKKTLSNLISAYQSMLPSALKAKKDFKINKKYISYIKKIDNEYIPKNNIQKELLEFIGNNEV